MFPPAGDTQHKGPRMGCAGAEEVRWHLSLPRLAQWNLDGHCRGRSASDSRRKTRLLALASQERLLGVASGESLCKVRDQLWNCRPMASRRWHRLNMSHTIIKTCPTPSTMKLVLHGKTTRKMIGTSCSIVKQI